jgi:hypothetical protein
MPDCHEEHKDVLATKNTKAGRTRSTGRPAQQADALVGRDRENKPHPCPEWLVFAVSFHKRPPCGRPVERENAPRLACTKATR